MVSLNIIISRLLASNDCGKLLTGDGITTSNLSVKGMQGIFDAISVDTKIVKKGMPRIGETASLAKNLDEYQFLVCSLIPSLPDSNPFKLQLQKYRIAIIASFIKLVAALKQIQQNADSMLIEWNKYAKLLLEETSETYVKSKSNATLQLSSNKDTFEFFEAPADKIDMALKRIYGQE
jgi:hypothetical protein